MPIPWKESGSPLESKVSKANPLNQVKRPKTLWAELFLTTMLLPVLATLVLVRIAFRLDTHRYFGKYYADANKSS